MAQQQNLSSSSSTALPPNAPSTSEHSSAAAAPTADTSVVEVPEEPEHPLEHPWYLYSMGTSRKAGQAITEEQFLQILSLVYKFDTVEKFWGSVRVVVVDWMESFSMYNNIIKPSQLSQNASFHLFKDGIQPTWEDVANRGGGQLAIRHSSRPSRFDEWWENTVRCIVFLQCESLRRHLRLLASNSTTVT